jgi:hypothetical protein
VCGQTGRQAASRRVHRSPTTPRCHTSDTAGPEPHTLSGVGGSWCCSSRVQQQGD